MANFTNNKLIKCSMFNYFLTFFCLVIPISAYATCVEIDREAEIAPRAELCTTLGCFNIEMTNFCGNYHGNSAHFTSVLGDLDTLCTAFELKTSDYLTEICRVTLNEDNNDISDQLVSCREMTPVAGSPDPCIFFGKDFNINFDRYSSIDFLGNDIAGADRKSVSLSQCESICNKNPKCVSYAYSEKMNWCFPKSGISEITSKLGITSGVIDGGCERNVSNMAEVKSCASERSSLGFEILLKKLIFELEQQKKNKLASFYEGHKEKISEEINAFCGLVLENVEGELGFHARWDTAINCEALLYESRELELKKLLLTVETAVIGSWNPWIPYPN